jgi:ABC-type nitrate/sulfonate/bicarbonate transport system substrate-binding protein
LTDYPDGVSALEVLLQSPASDVALATSSGFAFSSLLPVTKSIKIISQLANNEDNYYWMVKKGKGDGTVEGLKGLKLGYPAISGYRAFEEFSLQDHGLKKTDVKLMPMNASDFAAAMASGTIDAHPSRILLTQRTLTALKNQAYEIHDVGAYDWFNLLSATPHTIAKHPTVLKAVLAALLEAQTFSYDNPDLARADVAKSLKIAVAEVPKNLNDSLNIRLSNGMLRQLTKNRHLLAADSELPASAYFNKAQEVVDARLLTAIAPLVVHLG